MLLLVHPLTGIFNTQCLSDSSCVPVHVRFAARTIERWNTGLLLLIHSLTGDLNAQCLSDSYSCVPVHLVGLSLLAQRLSGFVIVLVSLCDTTYLGTCLWVSSGHYQWGKLAATELHCIDGR